MAWSSEVIAKITSPDLASDLAGAETLISRHKETRSEIDARSELVTGIIGIIKTRFYLIV